MSSPRLTYRALSLPSLNRRLRKPLLYVLAGAAALMLIYGTLRPGLGLRQSRKVIEITGADLKQMMLVWQTKSGHPPTPTELSRLVKDRVRREVLYREALSHGLGRNDPVIERRLARKMDLRNEDLSGIARPTKAQLRAWFDKDPERFAGPERISFRQIYFAPGKHGGAAREAAAAALIRLSNGESADGLTDHFMFQNRYTDCTEESVSAEFGKKFAAAIFALEPGAWRGPVQSGLGWHLVKVESKTPRTLPDFAVILPEVRATWLAEKRAELRRQRYEAMRAKYKVRLPPGRARSGAGKSRPGGK